MPLFACKVEILIEASSQTEACDAVSEMMRRAASDKVAAVRDWQYVQGKFNYTPMADALGYFTPVEVNVRWAMDNFKEF